MTRNCTLKLHDENFDRNETQIAKEIYGQGIFHGGTLQACLKSIIDKSYLI